MAVQIVVSKELFEDIQFPNYQLQGFKVRLTQFGSEFTPTESDFNQTNQFWETIGSDVLFYNTSDGLKLIFEAPDDPYKPLQNYGSFIFYYRRVLTNEYLRGIFVMGKENMVDGLNGLTIKNLYLPQMTLFSGVQDTIDNAIPENSRLGAIQKIVADNAFSDGTGDNLFDTENGANLATSYGYINRLFQDKLDGINNLVIDKTVILR